MVKAIQRLIEPVFSLDCDANIAATATAAWQIPPLITNARQESLDAVHRDEATPFHH